MEPQKQDGPLKGTAGKMQGLSRSQWRETPPIHFICRIESFSTLSSSWSEEYESCVFSAGGYEWKLALYPKGNKSSDADDHISLYLVLATDGHSKPEKEIMVSFTLLLFDHVQEKYFSVQEVSTFGANKTESGFDKFLPLKNFIDPSNGYLFNDTCMFGADIHVVENTPKEQWLSMMPIKPVPYKHVWKIENFSGLKDERYFSKKFTTRGHDWRLLVYPKGCATGKDNSLSLYLELADSGILKTHGRQVLVEYILRVVDQLNKKHKDARGTYCFRISSEAVGSHTLLPLSDLNNLTAGYLLGDTCIIEAEVTVLGSGKCSG